MYNEKLEAFISAALADGKLTAKDREFLFKNADSMGIDHDEFEMYLKSRLLAKREEEKQANSSFQALADKIEAISSELIFNRKDAGVLNQAKEAMNEEIINTIATFPVPNSTNGILEFLALACSKAKHKGGWWGTITGRMKMYVAITITIALISVIVGLIVDSDTAWLFAILAPIFFLMFGGFAFFVTGKDIIRYNKVAEAWHDKFEQVMLKGRSLQGDSEFTQQLNYYESKLEE